MYKFSPKLPKASKKIKGQSGYTLLFAILITSLVVAIGVSILSLARKELTLTSGARESQFAIYAADNAMECASYWDGYGAFSTSSPSFGVPIFCSNHIISTTYEYAAGGEFATSSFYLLEPAGGKCAYVEIVKYYAFHYENTRIISRGYNKGSAPYDPATDIYMGDCGGDSPDKVERALDYRY